MMKKMMPPTLSNVEFGVNIYHLTSEHSKNPCDLFDIMTANVDICAAGVFIGELRHLTCPESQQQQVNALKAAHTEDLTQKGGQRKFMPVVQNRQVLWREYGSMHIVPQEQKGRPYCEGRRALISEITSLDYSKLPGTELEKALELRGTEEFQNQFYSGIYDQNKVVWYGPGFSMPVGNELRLNSDLSMTFMDNLYLQHLKNKHNDEQTVFEGINSPTVYLGTEYSSFNLHIEDFAFESVNRHVAGADKIWFIIPPAYYKSFSDWMSFCGVARGGTDTNCSTYLQHKHNFHIRDVLGHMDVPSELVEKWRKGQLHGIFSNIDVRNPHSLHPGVVPPNPAFLLGSQHSFDLDCKVVEPTVDGFAGPLREEFYGGLTLNLSDDEEEQQEDRMVCSDEEGASTSSRKREYSCPFPCKCPCSCTCDCGYAPKSQGAPGLQALRSHMNENHRNHPDYPTIVQEVNERYDRNYRKYVTGKYSECELCGEKVVEKGKAKANLKRHQDSVKCHKRRKQPVQNASSSNVKKAVHKNKKRKEDSD